MKIGISQRCRGILCVIPTITIKEKVKSETIHFEVLKETNTVYNLYESGELDVAVLTGDFAKQNRDNRTMKQSNGQKSIPYV